jgi:SAM-dependent methyltransferase
VLYDAIGATYGATRRADPGISTVLSECVEPRAGARYLDIGCGTGNYTRALARLGGRWHGVDVSIQMLAQAKRECDDVSWTAADAEALPYGPSTFEGAVCTLAIHHFASLEAAFAEVFRVLHRGSFVLFTAFPKQMQGYWLCHYFPEMLERSWSQMPSETRVLEALRAAGFAPPEIMPFEINERVRANISSFAMHCSPSELERGLSSLQSDIADGRFHDIAKRYAGPLGDYAFVHAQKPNRQGSVTS